MRAITPACDRRQSDASPRAQDTALRGVNSGTHSTRKCTTTHYNAQAIHGTRYTEISTQNRLTYGIAQTPPPSPPPCRPRARTRKQHERHPHSERRRHPRRRHQRRRRSHDNVPRPVQKHIGYCYLRHITSNQIRSHHFASHHNASHQISFASHHIFTSHHNTSHHITCSTSEKRIRHPYLWHPRNVR